MLQPGVLGSPHCTLGVLWFPRCTLGCSIHSCSLEGLQPLPWISSCTTIPKVPTCTPGCHSLPYAPQGLSLHLSTVLPLLFPSIFCAPLPPRM